MAVLFAQVKDLRQEKLFFHSVDDSVAFAERDTQHMTVDSSVAGIPCETFALALPQTTVQIVDDLQFRSQPCGGR